MKRLIITLFTLLIFSHEAWSNTFRLTPVVSIYSKNLKGEDTQAGTEGKLLSNSNLHYGVKMSYALNKSLHGFFNYQSRSFDFDNTENIIAGEMKFDSNSINAGVKWILFSRTALRLFATSEKDLAFNVNAENKAEVFSEDITYFTIFFDQIVYLGASTFLGFKLGYDLPADPGEIKARGGTRGIVFATLGNLEINYEIKNYTKKTSDLDFTERDTALNLMYTLSF